MSNSSFNEFLHSLHPHSVLDSSFSKSDYVSLDLSINNQALQSVDVSNSKALEIFISNHIKANNGKIAYGGYLEKRGIYNRSTHFNQQNPETERNIHLGIDLWIEAQSPIYAPLDAEVHSFKNNANFGNYGPTIILKHTFEFQEFYTLYGHLSLESLQDKKVGQKINKGEQIATLGTAKVNGDYAPHLHFQIIKDIENYSGDYPGVSNLQNLEFYRHNCPNPKSLVLNLRSF